MVKKYYYYIFPISISVLVFFGLGLHHYQIVWGDSAYLTENSIKMLWSNFIYTWDTISLGAQVRNSLVPLLKIIASLFQINAIIQFFYFILPLSLAFISFRYSLKNLIKINLIKDFTSLFYVFNPVIFGDFHSGQNMWIYVFLPLVYYFLLDIFYFERFSLKNLLLLVLNSFILFGLLPPLIFVLFISFLVLLIIKGINLLINSKFIILKKVFIYGVAFCILFLLASLPFLLVVISGHDSMHPASTIEDYYHNYSKTNILNLFRLAGNEGNGQMYLDYNYFNTKNVFGYIFIILIVSFFLFKVKKYNLIFAGLFLTILILFGFTHLLSVSKEFGSMFFSQFWLASTIRNPAKLFNIILPLFAFTVAMSFQSLTLLKNRYIKNIIFLFLSISFFIYSWPLIRGDLGLFYKVEYSQEFIKDDSVTKIAEYSKFFTSRAILIPSNHRDELNFENLSRNLNTIRFGNELQQSRKLIDSLIASFNNQDSIFFNYLNLAGIEHVLVKKNIYPYSFNMFALFPTPLSYQEIDKFLNRLEVIFSNEQFTDFYNKSSGQEIYSPESVINLSGNNIGMESIAAAHEPGGVVISTTDSQIEPYTEIYEAYDTFTEIDLAQLPFKEILFDPNLISLIFVFKNQQNPQLEIFSNHPVKNGLKKVASFPAPSSLVMINETLLDLSREKETAIIVRPGLQMLKFVKKQEFDISDIDPSFENSQKSVIGDGSISKPGSASIYSYQTEDMSHGRYAITLGSGNHRVYTVKSIPVKDNLRYQITFKYKNIKGASPSFGVWQEGVKMVLSNGTLSPSNDWRIHTIDLTPPIKTTHVDLYLYTESEDGETSENSFDDIRFYQISSIQENLFFIESQSSIITINKPQDIRAWPTTKIEELIENGSFENPILWKESGDASAGMAGNPIVQKRQSHDAVSGEHSLHLEASNHIHYISQKIKDFDCNAIYKLSFYYKNISGSPPAFGVWQGGIDKSYPRATLEPNKIWSYYESYFIPDNQATGLSIFLYSPSSGEKTVNLFDDVKIEKVDFVKSYLQQKEGHQKKIDNILLSYKRNNPAKITIQAGGNSGMIVFHESFHSNWYAFVKNKEVKPLKWWEILMFKKPGIKISDNRHLIVNGYANGWWIDPNEFPEEIKNEAGEYEIILEFWPQRLFYLGLLISGTTLLGCIGYLVYGGRKKKRNKKQEMGNGK